jgi:hypothetical protein
MLIASIPFLLYFPYVFTIQLGFLPYQHINWKHNFKIIMDAVEDYARRWIKREVDQDPELESLSDWVRTIRSLVLLGIRSNTICIQTRYCWKPCPHER